MSAVNETRKHRLQENGAPMAPAASLPEASPAAEAPPVVLCRDCRHWDRRWPLANHAPCMLATKFSYGSALLTTDLQTCSLGERKPGR
jgi:hypothetical protein